VKPLRGIIGERISSPSNGVYWALTTLTSVGFGDVMPITRLGRCITSIWSLTALPLVCVFCALIGAQITANALRVTTVESLDSVTGILCYETNYPQADSLIARQQHRPLSIKRDNIHECLELLSAGSVQAVMADEPLLKWYSGTYSVPNLYISPVISPNPFAFMFPFGSPLRPYVNPAIILLLTTSPFEAQLESIMTRYLGRSAVAPSTVNAVFKPQLAAAVLALAALTVASVYVPSLLKRTAPRLVDAWDAYNTKRLAGLNMPGPHELVHELDTDASEPGSPSLRFRGREEALIRGYRSRPLRVTMDMFDSNISIHGGAAARGSAAAGEDGLHAGAARGTAAVSIQLRSMETLMASMRYELDVMMKQHVNPEETRSASAVF
jgi:hypothetical protein